jgi:hypothetical protein
MREPTIFKLARENAEAIRRIGEVALEQASTAGTWVSYAEPGINGIILEYPDGSRWVMPGSGADCGKLLPVRP